MRYFFLLILLVFINACQSGKAKQLAINGLTMGTSYSVKIIHRKDIDAERIQADIATILDGINNTMSTYIDESELSGFNQKQSTDNQVLSDDLYNIIRQAHNISQLTEGAFDITVGPLVNAWGFGPNPLTGEIPSAETLASIRQYTGYKKIDFDDQSKQLSKADPRLYIDLSGIAKGFAVDRIAKYLDQHGLQNYLVEIGGDLTGRGKNAKNRSWQIGIEQADPLSRNIQRIVNLDNMAMASSGDYRHYFEKEGIRYSHTIDPKTGKPIRHQLAAVTVLHHSAVYADALATAFMVMGPEATLTLANQLDIAVYLIIRTGAHFDEKYNRQFSRYLSDRPVSGKQIVSILPVMLWENQFHEYPDVFELHDLTG